MSKEWTLEEIYVGAPEEDLRRRAYRQPLVPTIRRSEVAAMLKKPTFPVFNASSTFAFFIWVATDFPVFASR